MTYILRHVLALIPILFLTWTAVFIFSSQSPNLMLSGAPVSQEVVANERAWLGLDKHVRERYLTFLGRAAVDDLGDGYRTRQPVTQGLDQSVTPAKTLALLGESETGKSVTALAILGVNPYSGGRLIVGKLPFRRRDGAVSDLAQLPGLQLSQIRGNEIAMIFQEPMTALNSVFTIGDQIAGAIQERRDESWRSGDTPTLVRLVEFAAGHWAAEG